MFCFRVTWVALFLVAVLAPRAALYADPFGLNHGPAGRQRDNRRRSEPMQEFCFPPFQNDGRYFPDPLADSLLKEIELLLPQKEKQLREQWALALKKNKRFPVADSGPQDQELLDYSLLFYNYNLNGLHDQAIERLGETIGDRRKAGSSKLLAGEKFPPGQTRSESPFFVIDWRSIQNDDAAVTAAFERLLPDLAKAPQANQSGLGFFREWANGGSKAFAWDKLSYSQLIILREMLLSKYEEESRNRFAEEARSGAFPFSFKVPRTMTSLERDTYRDQERFASCTAPETLKEVADRNRFVSGYSAEQGKPRHGLPETVRWLLRDRLNHKEVQLTIEEEGKLLRKKGQLTQILHGTMDELAGMPAEKAKRQIYNPDAVAEVLYRSALEDPVGIFEQFWRRNDDPVTAENDAETQKNRIKNREEGLQRLGALMAANGRNLTPAEREDLKYGADENFRRIDELVHGLGQVSKDQPLAKAVVQDLWERISGQKHGLSNLLEGLVIEPRTGAISFDPGKMTAFDLFPDPKPNMTPELSNWIKVQNDQILSTGMGLLDKFSKGSRGDAFKYFDEAYRRVYGETLSQRFCGVPVCAAADAKVPLNGFEFADIYNFLKTKQLARIHSKVAPPASSSERPSKVELQARQAAYELALVEAELRRIEEREGASPVPQKSFEDERMLRLWKTHHDREKVNQTIGAMAFQGTPQSEQFAKAVRSHQAALEKIDSYKFRHLVPPLGTKRYGETADIEIHLPSGGSYVLGGIPVEKLSSPEVFRNHLIEKFIDDFLYQAFPGDKAKRERFKKGNFTREESRELERELGNDLYEGDPRELVKEPSKTFTKQKEAAFWRVAAVMFLQDKNPALRGSVAMGPLNDMFNVFYDLDKIYNMLHLASGRLVPHTTDPGFKKVEILYSRPNRVIERQFHDDLEYLFNAPSRAVYDLRLSGLAATYDRMQKGTPEERKKYQEYLGYVQNFPVMHPLRQAVVTPSMPAHVARFASDPEIQKEWGLLPQAARIREHTLLEQGVRTKALDRDQVLGHLRQGKGEDRSVAETTVKQNVAPQKTEKPLDPPKDDPLAYVTENFVNATNELFLKELLQAKSDEERQSLLMRPPIPLFKLDKYNKSNNMQGVADNSIVRSHYLLELLRAKNQFEGKPGEFGSLHPKLAALVGDDKEKLKTLAAGISRIIAKLDEHIHQGANSGRDSAFPALPHESAVALELDNLEKALRGSRPDVRHEFIDSTGKLLTGFGSGYVRSEDEAYRISADAEMLGLHRCDSLIQTQYLDRLTADFEKSKQQSSYRGLDQTSRVAILGLPAPLKEAMLGLCDIAASKTSSPALRSMVEDLVYNPWPARILYAIQKIPEAREKYAARLARDIKAKRGRLVDDFNAKKLKLDSVGMKKEVDLLATLLGEKVNPPFGTGSIPKSMGEVIAQLPFISREERDKLFRWAMDRLLESQNVPKELKGKSPEAIFQWAAQRQKRGKDERPSQDLLVLLMAFLDESGDGETGPNALALESSKGSLFRFDPSVAAALGARERELEKNSQGAPATNKIRSVAKANAQLFSDRPDEPRKSIPIAQRIHLLGMPEKALNDLNALYHPATHTLSSQGLRGADGLWRDLAQRGRAGDIETGRRVLTPNSRALEGLESFDLPATREALRNEIASKGKLSDEGKKKLNGLAKAEYARVAVANFAERLLESENLDLTQIEKAIKQGEAEGVPEFERQIEKELRDDALSRYLSDFRAKRQAELIKEVASEKKKLNTDPTVIDEAKRRAAQEVSALGANVGVSPKDLKKTLPQNKSDKEEKAILDRHTAHLDALNRIAGFDRLATEREKLASAPTDFSQEKSYPEFFRKEFIPAYDRKIKALREAHADLSDKEIVDKAWEELLAVPAYQQYAKDLDLTKLHAGRSAEDARSQRGVAVTELAQLDVCGSNRDEFNALFEEAWQLWNRGTLVRADELKNSPAKLAWAEFQSKTQKERGDFRDKQLKILRALQDKRHEYDVTKRDLQNREEFMKSPTWRDATKIPPQHKRNFFANVSDLQFAVQGLKEETEILQTELKDLNSRWVLRERELAEEEGKEYEKVTEELSQFVSTKPRDRKQFLAEFIAGKKKTAFVQTADRLATAGARYFDWRERAESLAKTLAEESRDSIEGDERVKASVGSVQSCRDGFALPSAKAEQIIGDIHKQEKGKVTKRKELLDELGKWGIVWDGSALDFSGFKLEPRSAGGVTVSQDKLKKLLTDLGDYLPDEMTEYPAVKLGIIPKKTPWDKFKSLLTDAWDGEGRPLAFEWYDRDKYGKNKAVVGAAVYPKYENGEVTFEFSDLNIARTEAQRLAQRMKEKLEANVKDLNTLRIESNHSLQTLTDTFLGSWSEPAFGVRFFFDTRPYHDKVQQNLVKIQDDMQKLKAMGHIGVFVEENSGAVPSSMAAQHMGTEFSHNTMSSVHNTMQNIAEDTARRNMDWAVVIGTSLVTAPLTGGGIAGNLGLKGLQRLGFARGVTAPVALAGAGGRILHSINLVNDLHMIAPIIETDIIPAFGGKPSQTFWSDRVPAVVSTGVFGAAGLLGEGLGVLSGGARIASTLSAPGASTAGIFSKIGMARIAASPTTHSLLGIFTASTLNEIGQEALSAQMNGYDFHPGAALWRGVAHGGQNALFMAGMDQRFAALGIFKNYGQRLAASVGTNLGMSGIFTSYGHYQRKGQLTAALERAEAFGDEATAADLKRQLSEMNLMYELFTGGLVELPSFIFFGKAAAAHGAVPHISSKLSKLARADVEPGAFDAVVATAEREVKDGWGGRVYDATLGRIPGLKRPPNEQTSDGLIAAAMMQMPHYKIQGLREAAAKNPSGEAAKALGKLAEVSHLTPERFKEAYDRFQQDPGYRPQKAMGEQVEGVQKLALDSIERRLAIARKPDARAKFRKQIPDLTAELVTLRPERVQDLDASMVMSVVGTEKFTESHRKIALAAGKAMGLTDPAAMTRFLAVYRPVGKGKATWRELGNLVRDATGVNPERQLDLVTSDTLSVDEIGVIHGADSFRTAALGVVTARYPGIDPASFDKHLVSKLLEAERRQLIPRFDAILSSYQSSSGSSP